jgi:hypothetical protein
MTQFWRAIFCKLVMKSPRSSTALVPVPRTLSPVNIDCSSSSTKLWQISYHAHLLSKPKGVSPHVVFRMARSVNRSNSGPVYLEALTISYLLLARFRIVLVDVFLQVWPHPDQVWSATRVISMPVSDQLQDVSVTIGNIRCFHNCHIPHIEW